MNVALLHYHVKPGGVTTVIKHQIAALKDDCNVAVLASNVPNEDIGAKVLAVPSIAYDTEVAATITPEDVAREIERALATHFTNRCDVLHVHNPTLAKNSRLLKALELLRDRGQRLFLQIHDFAEDGRPDVYYDKGYVADVHYGVINSRDYNVLIKAGLKEEGLHIIENKVSPFSEAPPCHDGYVLYPVRAIRRKNMGEAILLSHFLDKDDTVAFTLPPSSASDIDSFSIWQSFVKQHNLRVAFNVAHTTPFPELVARAKFIITTSVNEGFGFTYLEPWTAGKTVFGRNLPHVCNDFKRNGLDLTHLYDAFYIPTRAFDVTAFYTAFSTSLAKHAEAFGYALDPAHVRRVFRQITKYGTIDFGVLDETRQMEVIQSVLADRAYDEEIVRHNPWLERLRVFKEDAALVARNRAIVLDRYGNENYREKLLAIYHAVCETPVQQAIEQRIVLAEFIKPEEYKMLRWKDIS